MIRTRLLAACCHLPSETTGPERIAKNREMMTEGLDEARVFRPDFVVFPELCLHAGVAAMSIGDPSAWTQTTALSETVPGPTSEIIAEKARELKCHVLLPLFEKVGDSVYNSIVLIDREGEVLGTYHKYYPTRDEIEGGVRPGEEAPVWETDRGRVGCAVCFDLKFPAVALALARAKAQVVFWPSMFEGGERLSSWARDYGFFMVKCTAGRGAVVDPSANTVATKGVPLELPRSGGKVTFTHAEVNTDRKTYHLDYNQVKLPEIVRKYGGDVEICIHHPEAIFTLASNLPDKRVEEIEREFELTDLRDYLDASAKLRESRLR